MGIAGTDWQSVKDRWGPWQSRWLSQGRSGSATFPAHNFLYLISSIVMGRLTLVCSWQCLLWEAITSSGEDLKVAMIPKRDKRDKWGKA